MDVKTDRRNGRSFCRPFAVCPLAGAAVYDMLKLYMVGHTETLMHSVGVPAC